MSILVGSARYDENGKGTGGKAGDQTGKEVSTQTWYSKPWDYMAIHPDESVREAIAKAVEDACANDHIGYDKNERNTLNTQAKKVGYDLSKITTDCECDCSALVNVACVAAGVGSYGSNGWTTSTMKSNLEKAGFTILTSYLASSSYCVRGAIYCTEGSHTVTGLTNGSKSGTPLSKVTGSTSSSTSSSKLDVDGEIGPKTVKRLQQFCGLTQTGTIGSQPSSGKQYWTSILSSVVTWSSGKSDTVRAFQKYLYDNGYKSGVNFKDGKLGKNTAKCAQQFLKNKGYYTGSVDSIFGANSAKALQKWLNTK